MKEISEEPNTKADERNVFLFITVILMPALAIAIVGVYGFTIWIYQILTGPPT